MYESKNCYSKNYLEQKNEKNDKYQLLYEEEGNLDTKRIYVNEKQNAIEYLYEYSKSGYLDTIQSFLLRKIIPLINQSDFFDGIIQYEECSSQMSLIELKYVISIEADTRIEEKELMQAENQYNEIVCKLDSFIQEYLRGYEKGKRFHRAQFLSKFKQIAADI